MVGGTAATRSSFRQWGEHEEGTFDSPDLAPGGAVRGSDRLQRRADETAAAAGETAIPVEPDQGIGDGATPPSASPTPAAGEDAIPQAAQGRWGLVPADCTSTRGDAKGLLTVSPTTLKFYESVGKLGAIEQRADDRIRAEFAFTGEGMNWTRDLSLAVQDDGKTLVRREFGADAAPRAFTYTRCS